MGVLPQSATMRSTQNAMCLPPPEKTPFFCSCGRGGKHGITGRSCGLILEREKKIMDKRQQQVQLMHLLDGMMRTQALATVAKLALADKLGDGRKSVSQLARETRTHEVSLSRLLRALASIGLFAEVQPSVFTQTALSSLLRSDHPYSLRDTARFFGSDVF